MYKTNTGLKHYAFIHGQGLANAQALPKNTSVDGNEGPLEVSGTNGAIEVVARIHADATIANAKTLTVKLQHSDDGVTFSDLGVVGALTAAAGSGALPADTELGRFALPSNVKEYLKTVIVTDDPAAVGKIDVIPTYLPR